MIQHKVFGAVVLAAASLSAHAGLTGDSVGTRFLGGGDTGVQTTVVGPGDEGNFFGNQIYDYGDASFTIRSTATFGGIFGTAGQPISLLLTSLDFGAPIGAVSFTTNLVGVTRTFTATSITFSWAEQTITAGTYLTAQISAVPEPASAWLLALGGVAVCAARRRLSA